MTSRGTHVIAGPVVMLDRVRAFIERVLPWYSPEDQYERRRRKLERIERAQRATERIRAAYHNDDERLRQ